MSWLTTYTPINLLEEKSKFFADETYNPQFIYPEEISSADGAKYGEPKEKYIKLAQKILRKAYHNRNEADLLLNEGPIVPHHEVEEKVRTFLEMHNLQDRYQIIWSPSFVSRATIDATSLRLRTTSTFRTENLLSLIYHELGTHALRRVNYEKQPWYKKKKKYGFTHEYLKTEEGLATLHSIFARTYCSAYVSAIRYVAGHYAQAHSFSELWKFVGQYIQDQETRWMVTFRQKRGITDTSQPGNFSRDIVYFEGLVEVWHWLKERNFNPTDLYVGKIALEDLPIALPVSNMNLVLPSFYVTNPKGYAKKMEEVGEENFFYEL